VEDRYEHIGADRAIEPEQTPDHNPLALPMDDNMWQSLVANALAAYYSRMSSIYMHTEKTYLAASAINAHVIDHYGPADLWRHDAMPQWVRWVLLTSSEGCEEGREFALSLVNTASTGDIPVHHSHMGFVKALIAEDNYHHGAARDMTAQEQAELLADHGLKVTNHFTGQVYEVVSTEEAKARDAAAKRAAKELRDRKRRVRTALKEQGLALSENFKGGFMIVQPRVIEAGAGYSFTLADVEGFLASQSGLGG
jgi:hypothetical protein